MEKVVDFHQKSASMTAITPPPIIVQNHRAPQVLGEGDEMEFTLWLGPLPVRWLARIEQVTPDGFCDRQLRGPFQEWVHRHQFIAIDNTTAEVRDEIRLSLRPHLLWRIVGLGMRLGLPALFAYRGWKTRRMLE
jgi:ligand-binding SRPBCC domain-containing protein